LSGTDATVRPSRNGSQVYYDEPTAYWPIPSDSRPCSPTGRDTVLKPPTVWVRIPPGAQIQAAARCREIDSSSCAALVPDDHGLAIVSIGRPDGSVHTSLVNVGVLPHPVTGEDMAAFVAVGGTNKVDMLREHPRATFPLRAGWRWAAVEGPV